MTQKWSLIRVAFIFLIPAALFTGCAKSSVDWPTITVSSPNGAEVWVVGSLQVVTWTSVGVESVKIELSRDWGATWEAIAASADAGSYSWNVTGPFSSNCLVRVTDAQCLVITDISDSTFTIIPPDITVTSPNGGQTWYYQGNDQTITWTSIGVTGNVDIHYSVNGGTTWTAVALNIANTGSYTWTISDEDSSTCLVRVQGTGGAGLEDVSDAPFTVTPATITVTSPNGAEMWYCQGADQTITWTSAGITGNVDIHYSVDSGTTWTTVALDMADTGSYTWTIPDEDSSTCLVRVQETGGAGLEDVSNAPFTITVFIEANFTASPRLGTAPLQVQFSDQSNSTHGITSWSWGFGDGGTSNAQNPNHTYNSTGSFTIVLTVTGLDGTDTQTKASYITVQDMVEDFETGDFSRFAWSTGGDAAWYVTNTESSAGIYSARAGTISHSDITYLEVTLTVETGNITFYRKVSSESYFDELIFRIDGVEQDRWSGSLDWSQESFPVTAGTRTFRWEYSKDGSVSSYDDTVWIDDIVFPAAPVGATIYVDGASGSDSNTGLSWAQAVWTIQTGLDKASSGWTVLVANGTYTDTRNKNLDFAGKAIHLKSVGGAANCIIDCESSGRGFYFHSGETSAAIVEGFTVQNGNVGTSFDVPTACGAGICCYDGNPTITGCILRNNVAYYRGGGIYCHSNSNAVITNCILTNGTGNYGGGIYCYGSTPTIVNCTIVGNWANQSGGGLYCFSGADPTFNSTIFWDNAATSDGDQIYINTGSATLNYCDVPSGGSGEVYGNVTQNSCIHLDPLFVNAAGGDYHLLPGSPCIDTGDPAATLTEDIEGSPRPAGSGYDIGAYEYQ